MEYMTMHALYTADPHIDDANVYDHNVLCGPFGDVTCNGPFGLKSDLQ